MDQTIRKILELDAATEEKLGAAEQKCRDQLTEARKQAAAIKQAQKHQTRDTIIEMEEQMRTETEQKIAEMRGKYDRRADSMTKQFAAQHDALLETLFQETLREAEA
ncbi:MAG TPA: hypothetical protein DCG49_09345 [Ruminococcus sp.]|nr:hypothetical protein [Ruminococcus sp.]